MPDILLPKRGDVTRFLLIASAAATGMLAVRYLGARKLSGAERLTTALLDTERLRDVARSLPDGSESVLAACAAYLIGAAYRASEGIGVAGNVEDPVGYSRTQAHPYTHAVATVLTESNAPEQILTYAVNIPDVGEVRGTRRVGGLRISGLSPARPTPDVAQVSLSDSYTAQMETEFEVADYLLAGRTRLFGPATLRDNQGNVGRIHVGYNGNVAGTITRDARVIGRFEGDIAHGLQFRQYQLESGG